MNPNPRNLKQIQRWMQSVIMHPDGIAAGMSSHAARAEIDVPTKEIERVIPRSRQLTSIERLEIYGNAYYSRLLECFHAEYPALRHACGEEVFDGLILEYLQAYPSRSYTLAELGRNLPRFLKETRPERSNDTTGPDWADLMLDLARLERAYAEVFDGPGVEGEQQLQADDLADIDRERWPQAILIPVPCLRLMKFDFPVHEFATAVRQQADPPLPASETTYLAITRQDYVVRRRAVNHAQFVLLSVLGPGKTLVEAMEEAAADADDVESFALELGQSFRNWTIAGYFQRVEWAEPT
jgi:hypothetical protein